MKAQNNNKRTNRYIEINGETKTLAQWCERYQINYDAVWDRIKRHNWDPLKALTIPVRNKKSSSKTTTNKLISNQTILNESSNLTNN